MSEYDIKTEEIIYTIISKTELLKYYATELQDLVDILIENHRGFDVITLDRVKLPRYVFLNLFGSTDCTISGSRIHVNIASLQPFLLDEENCIYHPEREYQMQHANWRAKQNDS